MNMAAKLMRRSHGPTAYTAAWSAFNAKDKYINSNKYLKGHGRHIVPTNIQENPPEKRKKLEILKNAVYKLLYY